jgi:group I intron endonuclease
MTYKIGRVYRIICLPEPNIQYIGSTLDTLRNRWQVHKKNKKNKTAITKYLIEYGIDNFKIVLIKEYQVVDTAHLRSKEQLWINKINCVNIKCSFRINWVNRPIDNKKYYEENKHKFKPRISAKYSNIYYEKNKEQMKANSKKYYNNNKEKIKNQYQQKKNLLID